jgi:hypothetical protein
MNSQELRNLQEAYLEVYEEIGLKSPEERAKQEAAAKKRDERKRKPSFWDKAGERRDAGNPIQLNLRRMVDTHNKKEREKRLNNNKNEAVDLYGIILSHLLDEGYADTQEGAEVIMVNMSEEWRESIVEGLGGARNQGDYEKREKERQRIRDEHLQKYKSGELPFQKQKKASTAQEFLKKHPKKTK